jgi:DMSO/TMAO reductase YedYZ heme-binding membrane subunit
MDRNIDRWMGESLVFSAGSVKKQSLALFILRLPAFIPLIFISRGWMAANSQDVLTKMEADVLGTGGEICFFVAVSITPIITLTGARWIAPLRRWYGIMFAVIGIADTITASITGDFAGGVIGRLAGHTFLLAGFLIILLALPLLATANTPSQRKLGRYWKWLQRTTYVIWGMIVIHLLLLDGFAPALLPSGRDQHPVGYSPAAAGAALDRQPAGGRAALAAVAGRGAAGRALPHRVHLHHQRGDLHRDPGVHPAFHGGLTLKVHHGSPEVHRSTAPGGRSRFRSHAPVIAPSHRAGPATDDRRDCRPPLAVDALSRPMR